MQGEATPIHSVKGAGACPPPSQREETGAKSGGERPRVAVIVPHYNDIDALSVCLGALQRQTYPSDRYEIIVVDNDSPEGSEVVTAAVGQRAHLRFAPERGAGLARNAGVAASTASILAFTDSDCTPDAGWLDAGVQALTRYDVVGGRMNVLVMDPAAMTPVEAFERVFAFDNESNVVRKGFSVSANLFCAREVFSAVGGFRTGISEDVDWCRRAVAAGYRIGYAPLAIVGHPARRTWRELTRKWRRLNAETFGLFRSRRGGRLAWLLRCFAIPASAVVHTPKAVMSQALATWSARAGALAVLYRIRLWRFPDAISLLFRHDDQIR